MEILLSALVVSATASEENPIFLMNRPYKYSWRAMHGLHMAISLIRPVCGSP
jgi:hypothetical protein